MNDIFNKLDNSLVNYWISNGLSENDLYCQDCGNLIIDLDEAKYVEYKVSKHGHAWFYLNGKRDYHENETNRWSIIGKKILGKIRFKKLCWHCFFKRLRAIEDIPYLARKGKWYGRLNKGIDEIPATFTTSANYFTYLFGISDDELKQLKAKVATASKEHFIAKYGEDEGLVKYEAMRARQGYTASTEYLIKEKGMTEEQAKAFHLNRASTKENFIKRYGKEAGEKRWVEYCNHEAYAGNTLTYFINKYGKELGIQKYKSMLEKKDFTLKTYSNISQELFKSVDKKLGDLAKNSRWETKNFEYELFLNTDGFNRITKVDYYLNGKIIEFNGDYWHANPDIYDENEIINQHNNIVAVKDIWNRDKMRKDALEKLGYQVKVIWESDYKNDPEKITNECYEFLKEEK